MNYLAEINAFDRWLEENYLPPRSQLLWYRLMALNNRLGWVEWMQVDNLKLMCLIGEKREVTAIDIRNKLIDAGLIEHRKGKKGYPTAYKITQLSKLTFKYVVKSEAKSVANTVVKTVANTVTKTVDIYKHKPKQEKIQKEKAGNNEKRFAKPSVAEIDEYCRERANGLDAAQFWDYYEGKGWLVGRTPMKDWRACVRTWERKQQGNASTDDRPGKLLY